ncbi:extracellular matrix regulator RemB [Salipaludibacillus sp. HK11]|uniref:extracellular matrix regulator RemB n=1 Tax=Salipaludibacillus sp. HK11 TaxID=3394320 RepID=UPI0039FD9572
MMLFIHLGGDMVLNADRIVAIVDHHSYSSSVENQEFLKYKKKQKSTVKVTEDTPKSFVITEDDVYLSPISSHTLKRRAETSTIVSEEE